MLEAAMPKEIKHNYHIRYKPKDVRKNKRDDKVTQLKKAINMDPMKIKRPEERILNLAVPGLTQLPSMELIMDFNWYVIPKVVVPLSKDQVADMQRRADDPNDDVMWIYEDHPFEYPLLEAQPDLVLLAPRDDALRSQILPPNITKLKANNAWAHKTGRGVRVGVLDTGIDKLHPDLAARYAGGYVINPGDNPDPGARPPSSHGTSCAGIIGAAFNNIGVVGIAYDCMLFSVRMFKISGNVTTTEAMWMAGEAWPAANGMDVINMSYGNDPGNISNLPRFDNTSAWSPQMRDEEQIFANNVIAGVMNVASAANGNDGGNRANKWADRTYPASYKWNVSVSAAHPNNNIVTAPPHWWGSNSGDSVAFIAPGDKEDPRSTRSTPDGNVTFSLTTRSDPQLRDGYGNFNGTSMAGPHVCGVAALCYAAYKYQPCVKVYTDLANVGSGTINMPGRIAKVMAATADILGRSGWRTNRSRTTGWGMPNAERAVRALLNINNEGNAIDISPSAPLTTQSGNLTPVGLFA